MLQRPLFDRLERERVRSDVRRALFAASDPVKLARFEIRARIGAGAMGVVYAAHDPELDRSVALKVLEPGSASELARQRLVREAQALARLSHPNVVTVHEVGSDAGRVFIAMELVDGDSLDRFLSRHQRAWQDILRILVDAGSGIAAAHDRGLVHRDIKPSNIVVDTNQRPRVVDFGLARADLGAVPGADTAAFSTKLTRTRGVLGTPAYASPEQLEGLEADARSDQFSFAATAWEALTGQPPFQGESVGSRLAAIRAGAPQVPRGVLGEALQPLRRALAFDPAARHPSMRALLDALGAAAVRAGRRRRLARGAFALAAVTSIPILAFSYWPKATGAPSAAADSPRTLLQPGTILACPVLEVSGDDARGSWLGAAAANLACRRATWLLGGNDDKVLVPAALLELPRQPVDAPPEDPWERSDVRGVTLEAAKHRAWAHFDGRVGRERDGFVVTLTLQKAPDRVLGTGTGKGLLLHVAVRHAMEQLEASGAMPVAAALDPQVARWTGIRTPQAGALLGELGPALETVPDPRAECRALSRHAPDLGFALVAAQADCDTAAGVTERPDVPLDKSSIEALAGTAPAYFSHGSRRGKTTGAAEVAQELAAARAVEQSPVARRQLAWAEAQLRLTAGDSDRAGLVLLDLAERSPSTWGLYGLFGRSVAVRTGVTPHSRTGIAWGPESPMAWEAFANQIPLECKNALEGVCTVPAGRAIYQRRAVELAPAVAVYAMHLALRLLDTASVNEARALGARLASMPDQAIPAAYILGLADAREGWLGRGLDRMRRELAKVKVLDTNRGSLSLMMQTQRLAAVLGKQREVADEIARRFVLSDRPLNAAWQLVVPLVAACMHASRDVAGRCLLRIREQRAEGESWPGGSEGTEEFARGAERFARGDVGGAVDAWRRFADTGYYIQLPVEAFDQTGNSELAAKLDAPALRTSGPYAGIHPAWAREAKRAKKRGDLQRARRLAQRVIEAWSTADVPVPAVAEMRAILAG